MTAYKIKNPYTAPPPAFQSGQWVLYEGKQYRVTASTHAHAQLEGLKHAIATWQLQLFQEENSGLVSEEVQQDVSTSSSIHDQLSKEICLEDASDNSVTSTLTDCSSNVSEVQTPSQTDEEDPDLKVEIIDEPTYEELTPDEVAARHRLELKVERAFYEAGCALRELRERRLYRSTHKSWQEYCRDRFGYGRDSADLKILASSVVENLQKVPAIGRQILPTNERQVRPLTQLEPDEQCQVWKEAVHMVGGKVPSGRIVKGIVERLKEKPLVNIAESYHVGDVFTLIGLSGSERKYNGAWALASDVNEFTLEVEVHDAVLIVKPDNLNRIDLPDAQRQLPVTLKRIKRLRDCGLLDRGAYNVLEDLGRHIYLTEVEEILLAALEKYYGFE